jgi:hypothetical protein
MYGLDSFWLSRVRSLWTVGHTLNTMSGVQTRIICSDYITCSTWLHRSKLTKTIFSLTQKKNCWLCQHFNQSIWEPFEMSEWFWKWVLLADSRTWAHVPHCGCDEFLFLKAPRGSIFDMRCQGSDTQERLLTLFKIQLQHMVAIRHLGMILKINIACWFEHMSTCAKLWMRWIAAWMQDDSSHYTWFVTVTHCFAQIHRKACSRINKTCPPLLARHSINMSAVLFSKASMIHAVAILKPIDPIGS